MLDAKGLRLHTAEFPDLPLAMVLRELKNAPSGTPRLLQLTMQSPQNKLWTSGFLHRARTSSSLGQTNKLESHPEFFPEFIKHFGRLGIQIVIPPTMHFEGGAFDGVIDREKLARGNFAIEKYFNRERESLRPEPLVVPIVDRATLLQLAVTFTYSKTALDNIFTSITYDFE